MRCRVGGRRYDGADPSEACAPFVSDELWDALWSALGGVVGRSVARVEREVRNGARP